MTFAKRFRSGAVAAAALLAVLLLLCSSVVLADTITSSVTTEGQTFDGTTQNLASVPNYLFLVYTACTVKGSGLAIVGKTGTPSSTDVGVYYRFISGTISAPVTFENNFPANSAFLFSTCTVSMTEGSTNAFVIANAALAVNTSLTLTGVTATWPAGATGALLSGSSTFTVSGKSSIFIEDSTVTNARSVLYVSSTTTSTAVVTGGSVVAIDEVTCTGLSSSLAAVVGTLTVSDSSLFRVRMCNSGAQPLAGVSGAVAVSGKSLFTVVDSNSTDALFAFPARNFVLSGGSVLSVMNLTAPSTGLTTAVGIPSGSSDDSTTYGDNLCVIAGSALASTTEFRNVGLFVTSLVDSKAGACSAAECVPGLSGAEMNTTDGGCKCECEAGTYQPYCTYVSDPLNSAIGGNTACTLFKCTQCSSSDTTKCEACQFNYTLNSATGACVRDCQDANCASCGDDGVCTGCNSGYELQPDSTCRSCRIANCATCSAVDTCAKCNTDYTLFNNACVLCTTENCLLCETPNVCETCVPGYSLNDGKCGSCTTANCAHCTAAGVCDECNSRYSLTSTKQCVECEVANCLACETAGVCSQCAAKYTLSGDGKCIPCDVPRCKSCSSSGTCGTCEDGYKVGVAGACYVCPDTCNLCSSDNVCSTCAEYYSLVGNACVECRIDYCRQCSAAGVCSSCTTGRKPDSTGASCILDVACDTGYYKDTDGSCKPTCNVANCLACSAPNVCSSCTAGRVLSSDKKSCVCPTASCAACNPAHCTECIAGYTLTSGYLCVRTVNAAVSPLSVVAGLLSFLVAALAVVSL